VIICAPTGLADLMPTLLDIAGIEAPDDLDGQSLLPRLADPRGQFRDYTFGNCNESFAVSNGHYRYQWSGEHGYSYLFDQDNDPRDEHDFSDQPEYAKIREELHAVLTDWMARHGDSHVKDGELQVIPVDRRMERGRAHTVWNNRGRHGLK